ncbi:putative malic acid transport protein [Madurella mycetomatis]|uniref:Putative malic acid transport protein n=1 Tax=Madurella mycetomatis TaxID=100816 RepID=A0A175WF60_9PEZI|nr:putative malic acid transport protein [Madurella mycetomatis]KXX82457.1 putative malic acid transport protein [Madurella mycetomatis]
MGLAISHPRQDRSGSKSDTESTIPPPELEDGNPAPPEPTLVVLERIPTYLQPSLPWRRRLLHFTFAWYTVTMSTSGIALTIAVVPHRFRGLSHLGLSIFLLDLVFFLCITLAIIARFVLYRPTLRRAFTRPSESLFVPTLFLSLAAILSNVDEYGRLFLGAAAHARLATGFLPAAFWAYLSATFALSVVQYHLLFTVRKTERRLTVGGMTPAWILPILPVMLAGTVAAGCAAGLRGRRALAVLCAGLAAQGLGILVSVFFYATYLSRLMAFGLPAQRPGMFIAVGPPSFTCSALVAMAAEVPRVFAELGEDGEVEGVMMGLTAEELEVLAGGVKLLAIFAAMFLWGLSFWFFASATAAVVVGTPDRRFHLSWWSFVFPNVGLTLASMRMGTALGSRGLLWFSTAMTVLLFLVWTFVAFRCIRAVYKREIVWPGHDEDEG